MNLQTLIFGILACLVLFLAMLVVIVAFVGILRIAIISVFDFDFVESYKKRKGKTIESRDHKKQFEDLPLVYLKSVKEKKDENI